MTTENSRADALTERDYDLHEHEQGLYRKFDVRRVDGSSEPGGKHHDCEYFVLDMTHDQHARAALRAYADACASTHPELSADLIARYALAPIEQTAAAPIDEVTCARMGHGIVAIGECFSPELQEPGVIFMKLPEQRDIGLDTGDVFPEGSRAPSDKMLAYISFANPNAIDQTISVLQRIKAKHFPAPAPAPAAAPINEDAEIPPIMYNGDTKRDPALRELLNRQVKRHVLSNPRGDAPAPSPADERTASWYCCDPVQICSAQCDSCAKQARAATEIADERAVSFEAWCDRFPEISAVERLRDAWQEARAALPEDRIDWIANTHCPGGTAYPVNVKNAIREALREARISDNETGAEGAIVGAWLTEDGRAISAEQKAGMLRDGGAGASSVQPYSIPCYLGAASAMAAEAVAFEITEQAAAEWASRHDVDHVLKHFSTQRNAIEDARTLHLLAAAPQPAQAGARVGLTDEQRDAIDFVIGWYEQSTIADNPYREHIAALRALLSARPAESWQVEIDAYKREVRELEAVLRIPEKIEDDWIRADVHSPTEAGIPHDDDVLAWNNDPGFATIISASFISPSFPEYTHWKKKPEAPADIDHAKGVDHAE
ncbi:gp43 [Burkholderia pseudomallei]|nr:gp43 [Burkholderia pseudomallei]